MEEFARWEAGFDPSTGDARWVAAESLETALGAVRRFWLTPAVHRAYLERSDGAVHRPGVYRVLRVLDLTPSERPSVSDVAKLLRVEVSTASRMVDAAVADGLVQRQADPDDGRRTCLVLTPTGRDLVRRLTATRVALLAEMTDGWPIEDVTRLAGLLDALMRQADHYDEAPLRSGSTEVDTAP